MKKLSQILFIVLLSIFVLSCTKNEQSEEIIKLENYIFFNDEYSKITSKKWNSNLNAFVIQADRHIILMSFKSEPNYIDKYFLVSPTNLQDTTECSFSVSENGMFRYYSLEEKKDSDNYFESIITVKRDLNQYNVEFANVKMTEGKVLNGQFKANL